MQQNIEELENSQEKHSGYSPWRLIDIHLRRDSETKTATLHGRVLGDIRTFRSKASRYQAFIT